MVFKGETFVCKGTLDTPEIGDIRRGRELGLTRDRKYTWLPCEVCANPRWVALLSDKPRTNICKHCASKSAYSKMKPKRKELPPPTGTLENPTIGDMRFGNELGFINNQSYKFVECSGCHSGYWHRINDIKMTSLCRKCYDVNHAKGEDHYKWKGGHINNKGYRVVCITKDSPFWEMGQKHNGYIRTILEHRLVMAIHLGRCLKPWEEVHHKGERYPKGSIEDKQDNRLENLELETKAGHQGYTTLENQVRQLERKVNTLKEQLKASYQLAGLLLREANTLGGAN